MRQAWYRDAARHVATNAGDPAKGEHASFPYPCDGWYTFMVTEGGGIFALRSHRPPQSTVVRRTVPPIENDAARRVATSSEKWENRF